MPGHMPQGSSGRQCWGAGRLALNRATLRVSYKVGRHLEKGQVQTPNPGQGLGRVTALFIMEGYLSRGEGSSLFIDKKLLFLNIYLKVVISATA